MPTTTTKFLPPVSESERHGIEKIREIFGDEIPADLNTDFNLRRWICGWKGDVKQIEPRLRAYIQNRRVLKLDAPDLLERPDLDPIMEKAFRHLSLSVRTKPLVNPIDNTVVVYYRLEDVDLNGLTKMFTPSEYLYSCIMMSEVILRHVLRQEAETGRPSGISLLYDLHGIHLSHFINPAAAHMKLGALVMSLQQDYYCDMLHQIICVRVPGFMSVLWEIMKKFLNEGTQKKFQMYSESKYRQHLFEYIHPSCVPLFYGGQYRETTETTSPHLRSMTIDDEMGVTLAQPVLESEFYKHTWTPDEWTWAYIKPKQTLTIVRTIKDTRKILRWQFETHSNMEFAVYHTKEGQDRQLVIPKLTLITPHFPEENHLACKEHGAGDYIFEFSNHSTTWFSLKLAYCIIESDE